MTETDPLAKWRKAGYKPVEPENRGGVTAVAPLGIKPREYKAFVCEDSRVPLLLIKSSLVKKAAADLALPYAYITKVDSDGYGFVFGLTFSVPIPVGAIQVRFQGEGMGPLLDGILRGVVSKVTRFDPDRHLPTADGDFDVEADEWRGPCMIGDITIIEQGGPLPNNTKH